MDNHDIQQVVKLYGGIEAGGTKFVCAVGSDPNNVVAETRFPTTTPEETVGKVVDFFEPFVQQGMIDSIGLASFGPLDLDKLSPKYGFITSTPKPGWRDFNIVGVIQKRLQVSVVMETDVNGAAYGEFIWGRNPFTDPLLYLTVGTGIGGGLIKDHIPYHGLLTPEMGHIHVPHDRVKDPFPGACPFHGDCFEGLAAGPAIEQRFGRRGEEIPDNDPFWEIEAGYVAYALASYILIISPRMIVVGGGVMGRQAMWPMVRSKVQEALNGYVVHYLIQKRIDEYIVPPELGGQAGVLGALAIARDRPTHPPPDFSWLQPDAEDGAGDL